MKMKITSAETCLDSDFESRNRNCLVLEQGNESKKKKKKRKRKSKKGEKEIKNKEIDRSILLDNLKVIT